jgi:hypothetical protein
MSVRLFLPVVCASILLSCGSISDPAPADKSAYVGTYRYKSMDTSVDKATDHELDQLVLQAGGRYSLVQGGSTKPKSTTEGIWRLVPGNPPNIELDHSGYPIEVKQGQIRLLINDDLGEWYSKAN